MPLGIVGIEHSIEHSFEVADLIAGVDRSQLSDGIAGSIDQGINARAGDLMVSASDFKVEGRDGIVSRRDIGIKVSLCDIFDKRFMSVFEALVCSDLRHRRIVPHHAL